MTQVPLRHKTLQHIACPKLQNFFRNVSTCLQLVNMVNFEFTDIFKNLFHQIQGKERAASGNLQLSESMKIAARLCTFIGSLHKVIPCIHSSLWTSNYCRAFVPGSQWKLSIGWHLPWIVYKEVFLAFGWAILSPLHPCWQRPSSGRSLSRAHVCPSLSCVRRDEKMELSLSGTGHHVVPRML